VTVGADGNPFVDPVLTYKTLRGRGTDSNAFGVTVTGGYVYRGKALPSLAGKYVFADWSRSMAIPDGTLLVATVPPGNAVGARWTVEPLALRNFRTAASSPTSGRWARTPTANSTFWRMA
jgi:hypothetical protein